MKDTNDFPVHFTTMLAASIQTNDKVLKVKPNNSYTNVTRFDRSAVVTFCEGNKGYRPLKMAIGSSLGDYIAIFGE